MSNPDRAIELLIIDSSLDSAESQISTLRNAGMAIHPKRVNTEADILDALSSGQHDVILCSADVEKSQFERNVELCIHSSSDASLIIMYKDQEPDPLLNALRLGARDVVSINDPEHLQLVVKREFSDLLIRRDLQDTQRRLREAETRCSTLVESSRDAIAYIHEGMHVLANPVYLQMFGYIDLEELEGLPILDMIAREDLPKFKKFLRTAESSQGDLEINCQKSEGEPFKARLEFSPASIEGEPCTQIIIRNSDSSRQLEQKIEQISSHDPQTGLYNRQFLTSQLDRIIAKGESAGKTLALFYITIDEFQKIRSEAGIAASDSLLQEFANLLISHFEEKGILARFGDHSFTNLLEVTHEQASNLANQLHKAVAAHLFRTDKDLLEPRCNIGISYLTSSTPSSQEFINNAYSACGAARTGNNNGTAFYDEEEMRPEFGNEANETRLNELIQNALDNNGFKLVYQPVVSLQGESREFYAVLTRLLDTNGDEILPNHFMGAASQANQMALVDRWVIKHAIQELVSQREKGQKVQFFITLSLESLEDKETLLWICDCLRDQRAKGAWLIFQVREADLRSHLTEARALLDGLKKIKCQIAIDRYGVLSKSDTLLKHLPIDYVKFDPTLVEGIAGNQSLQDSLVKLNTETQSHGVKTIVMGVEDANSLAVLWTIGVNYIQGYFLQEPSESISYEFTGT
ncbi:MAG: EAL domain-containing protein [Chromatiaceae bacterium]|nr:EAL domain-containing protein [Gammaproteobacteria bacterium]MCB1860201.1 EAL domain-containing protein [Gammaproteobacteria bacterium]MCB1881138.1 EAL domain-containing protein [Gammaproteobacteria bacterium]MCB1903013.1 EAL domain-containing protein [Gammaproteobacteria bacterium]MCP5446261.1 EAL domain-containing protein [Chromatiaceae bacterium]